MEGLEERLRGLSVTQRSHPEEPTYLLDMSLQAGHLLAVSCSNFSIRLHDRASLQQVGDYRGHKGPLCGVEFSHSSPDLLYSASADGTVRGWDIRCPGTDATQVFKSDPSLSYCSFDLNCSDRLLCAGTEQINEEDSYLVFWDARKPGAAFLGVYSESHSDDITQVRFHPLNKDRLATSSTDGLTNVFDVSQTSEDDALLATCNCDSTAGALCWSGADYTQLLCLSHDEGLHLWDLSRLDTDEPLCAFSTGDARGLGLLPDGGGVDYLVGGAWLEGPGRLLVLGGQNGGRLHLMECDGGGLRLLRSLEGGHGATVRCFQWDGAQGALYTGGEDAQLLLWSSGGAGPGAGPGPGAGAGPVVAKKESMKSDSALKLKARPHKKHEYRREKKDTK